MEIETKIKVLAESKLFGMHRLCRIGGSYSLILPKHWVEIFMHRIDDDYYCHIDVVNDTVVLRPASPKDVEGITVKGEMKPNVDNQ